MGHGQTIYIKAMPEKKQLCPVEIMKDWMDSRGGLDEEPVFVMTKGKNVGKICPENTLRSSLARYFVDSPMAEVISTHSLRKGGATFYRQLGYDLDTIQMQGGWKTQDVMKSTYTALTNEAFKQSMLGKR